MNFWVFIEKLLLVFILVSCVPETNKKCKENQVLVNGACVLKEQQVVLIPTPTVTPTPVPTIFLTPKPTIMPSPTPVPTIPPQLSCGTITSGEFEVRTMYQTAAVNEGQTCISEIQNRKCTNGQFGSWSGTYTQSKCIISRIRYESDTVQIVSACKSEQQLMTCENAICGVWIPNNYSQLTCSSYQTAPSISSASISGTSLTLSGTAFGTKPNPAPLRFEQFEGTTAGNTVPSEIAYWTGRGGTKNGYSKDPLISSTNQRSSASTRNASVYLARSGGSASVAQMAWHNSVGFRDTGKVYVNFWVYFDPVDSPIFRDKYTYYQIKLVNIDTSVDSSGNPVRPYISEIVFFDFAPPHYSGSTQVYHRNGRVSHPDQSFHYANDSVNRAVAGWYNISLASVPGTNDDNAANTDGWRIISITNGTTAYQVKSETGKNYLDDETKGINPIDAFKFGWYLGNNIDTGSTTLYYDDIYLDNTFSRVEIGDAATYTACTKRELQPPTAWATGTISAMLNRGSFNVGDSVYVYVINSDNVASAGYGPITLSGAAGNSKL